MVRAFLEAAGHRVHVYSSPHLVRFNERIRLAGRLIGESDLLALLEECERVNGDTPITYFEITTAAAFHAFARAPADFLLLETGLGGRADSTNVVDRPVATAITPMATKTFLKSRSTSVRSWRRSSSLGSSAPTSDRTRH